MRRPLDTPTGLALVALLVSGIAKPARAAELPTAAEVAEFPPLVPSILAEYARLTGVSVDPSTVRFATIDTSLHPSLRAEIASLREDAMGVTWPVQNFFSTLVPSPTGPDCLILFPRAALLAADSEDRRSTLAHELFHCVQYRISARVGSSPRWLFEGMAEFAALEVTPSGRWAAQRVRQMAGRYETSLFGRDYDAYPFFAALSQHRGTAAWRDGLEAIRRWSADPLDEVALEAVTAGYLRPFFHVWPKGLALDYERGDAWVLALPGDGNSRLMGFTYPYHGLRPGGAQPVEPLRVEHFRAFLEPNRLYRVRTTHLHGAVAARDLDGVAFEEPVDSGLSEAFCFNRGRRCECPGGGEISENYLPVSSEELRIVVAALEAGDIEIVESPPVCCSASPIDPRLVGTWTLDMAAFERRVIEGSDECRANAMGTHTMTILSDGRMIRVSDLNWVTECEYTPGRIYDQKFMTDRVTTGCVYVDEIPGLGTMMNLRLWDDTHWLLEQSPPDEGRVEISLWHLDGRMREPSELFGSATLVWQTMCHDCAIPIPVRFEDGAAVFLLDLGIVPDRSTEGLRYLRH